MVANETARGGLNADELAKPRHRLGLAGAFVVWLIVFAGMVAYLAGQ